MQEFVTVSAFLLRTNSDLRLPEMARVLCGHRREHSRKSEGGASLRDGKFWATKLCRAARAGAFAKAREETLAAGLSVLQSEKGVIYEVFPDGTRIERKRIAPPTPIRIGTKILIGEG